MILQYGSIKVNKYTYICSFPSILKRNSNYFVDLDNVSSCYPLCCCYPFAVCIFCFIRSKVKSM